MRFFAWHLFYVIIVVAAVGFEPTTNRVWTEYSSQLSYAAKYEGNIPVMNDCGRKSLIRAFIQCKFKQPAKFFVYYIRFNEKSQ